MVKTELEISQIQDLLPNLDIQDLENLSSKIQTLLSLKNGHKVGKHEKLVVPLIFQAISQHLNKASIPHPPWFVIRKGPLHKPFQENAKKILPYFSDNFGNLRQIEKQSIYHMGVGLLIQSLQSQQVPISAKVLIVNLSSIPSLIDRAFPGYRQAGLLQLVAKQFVEIGQ